ncbi:formate-dependent nitrite reductase subunit NrfC [Salmonella enterica subsp. enterica serovar Typhimurium]|nr:formate-dependent nitrite reductase subunit NrfC [Salmonella enterica subsp. enterica serovar Typhimurium]
MSCTRRQFITRVGALAAVSGMAGRVVANTLNINGVRYGMVHDESLCIGCTACMDACREVNTVPEGVSRLTIIRSEPQGTFPDVKYRFFRHSCQHCDHAPCVDVCPTGGIIPRCRQRYCRRESGPLRRLPVLHCRVSLPRALYPSGQ